MSSGMAWRAGFEIELILGGLGLPQFDGSDEPMDRASPAFCQAVARELRYITGENWSAPRGKPLRPGFYVIQEYDLDPFEWPTDRLAGVELLTPPLELEQAESVRAAIRRAILEVDGDFNFEATDVTAQCAWHINIDCGSCIDLDEARFIFGVDEQAILAVNSRLLSQYAAPQHHAYGIPLLKHLRADQGALLLGGAGFANLLSLHAGRGKRYAANFAKLDRGYLELRHFSAATFFGTQPLSDLLRPVIEAFERGLNGELSDGKKLLDRFGALRSWLEQIRPKLAWDCPTSDWCIIWQGEIRYDGEPIASLIWNGGADISLLSTGESWEHPSEIRDVQLPDICDAVAILALDVADHMRAGRKVPQIRSGRFRAEVDRLAELLGL